MITPRQLTALANGATRFTVPVDPQPRYRPFQIHGDRPDSWWNENPNHPRRGPLLGKQWRAPFKPGDRIPLSEDRYATVLSCEPCKVGEISADETVDEGMAPSTVPGIGSDSSFVDAYRAAWESDYPGVPFDGWGWTVVVESK